MTVDLKPLEQSAVFSLHVVWEHLDSEEAHPPFPVEELERPLDHQIERLEQKGVKVLLHLLICRSFLEVLELFRRFACTPLLVLSNLPMILSPCSLAKFT